MVWQKPRSARAPHLRHWPLRRGRPPGRPHGPVTSLAVRSRLVLLASAAAALVATASACSTVSPDAAKVGSAHISQRDFERDLNSLLTNEGFKQQATSFKSAAEAGAVTSDLTRGVLNLEIRQQLVHLVAMAEGVTVGQPATADEAAAAYGFSAETWAALPARFQNRWASAVAEQQLVQNTFTERTPDEAAVNAFYEQNKDQISGQTLEQVRPQIVQAIQAQSFQKAVADAAQSAGVRVDPRYGVWDPSKAAVAKLTPPTAGADKPVVDADAGVGSATTQP
jgi:hypothetical protein